MYVSGLVWVGYAKGNGPKKAEWLIASCRIPVGFVFGGIGYGRCHLDLRHAAMPLYNTNMFLLTRLSFLPLSLPWQLLSMPAKVVTRGWLRRTSWPMPPASRFGARSAISGGGNT